MPYIVEQIADFAAGTRFEDIASDKLPLIKQLVLDTLGCAVAASDAELVALIKSLPQNSWPSGSEATVICGGRASLHEAIAVNGTMVRYLDYLDVYWARDVCHPSENIPVALACAEAWKQDGRQLITAIAIAYEVQIAMAQAFSFPAAGLHHVSASGFIAPAIMGKMKGLTPKMLAHAIALGGVRHLTHGSLLNGQLSMAKAICFAFAASDSVNTTEMAARGFTGPLSVLDDLLTLNQPLDLGAGHPVDPARSIPHVSLKNYPVQFSLHAPIEAALEIAQRHTHRSIETVDLHVTALTFSRTADAAKFAPDSRETADHSLPCCVAMALIDGELSNAQFEAGRWSDADISSLMRCMRVHVDEALEAQYPAQKPARVVVKFTDGGQDEACVVTPLGTAGRPFTWQQTEKKFRALTSCAFDAPTVDQIVDHVQRLESLGDVGSLTRLMQRTNHPNPKERSR